MTINYDQNALQIVPPPLIPGTQQRDWSQWLGDAVPAGVLAQGNTGTPGVVAFAVAGTIPFDASKNEILALEFTAIGAAGTTDINIDDTAQAPAVLGFNDATGSLMTPPPTAHELLSLMRI